MTPYKVRLAGREEIAAGTMAFHFEKPDGFRFKPGQAIDVVLTEASTSQTSGARHTFSLVSAPFQDELIIATRMRDSAFKRALKALPIGSPVNFEGPFGSLTLHSDRARPAILIAGGIGITPFMSILRQATKDRLAHRLRLLYSNRRPEDAAFLAELQQLERQNENFRLVATMTELSNSGRPWNGKTGLINEELVKSTVADLPAPIYYIVGPPGMVETMRVLLGRVGVVEDNVRTEEFYGY